VTGDQFDPYAVLGVNRGADTRTMLAAYRAQARRHHPDIAPGPGAQRKMAELNAAWAILRDPLRRAAWDEANGLAAMASHDLSRPHVTTSRVGPTGAPCTWRLGRDGEGAAGPPPGHPSGSILTFGRHLCWSIGEIARVDPGYLRWLSTRPEGRPFRAEIEAILKPFESATPPPRRR
jgi:curved DNA-binding protein CbpA